MYGMLLICLVSAARSGYSKSAWYAGQKVEPDRPNLFSMIDEKAHSKRRAQVALGVSARIW